MFKWFWTVFSLGAPELIILYTKFNKIQNIQAIYTVAKHRNLQMIITFSRFLWIWEKRA